MTRHHTHILVASWVVDMLNSSGVERRRERKAELRLFFSCRLFDIEKRTCLRRHQHRAKLLYQTHKKRKKTRAYVRVRVCVLEK